MLSSFEQMFGITPDQIRPLCVLAPFLTKTLVRELGLRERLSGRPYASFQHPDFTLIETRMGPLFSGDAVLALKDSRCRTIVLLGACGSLKEDAYPVGALVSPRASYALESFSLMASQRLSFDLNAPARTDPSGLFPLTTEMSVQCASIGSLALEDACKPLFEDYQIDVLDMECASVFTAANVIQIYSSALLYVTDIIGKTSPYTITNSDDIERIESAQVSAAHMILTASRRIT